MKTLLWLAPLLLTGSVSVAGLVILDKSDCRDLETPAAAKPAGPDQTAFLGEVKKDLAQPAAFEEVRTLESPPPTWGKVVNSDSGGILRYHASFRRGFVCHLTVEHLLPGHRYILTLNGDPDRAGNELLPDPVPGHPLEKYYDFLTATTDERGRYDASLAVYLQPGTYSLRFYVKDTDDFKIVLYRAFFKFTVE
jgi:hypothetical protein